MPLSSGTRLGPYEVLGPLGAGGMGEVYRARDTRLGRDVAIKLLPGEVASDGERLARFRREAHLLASLNHPHIAAVHGLEELDGKLLLVLELVEGEDLAERLKRGAIPVEEALGIAKQIAEALEEAHEKGIVHRDLKPANIKLTPEGKAKVLDFGLAKAYAGDQAANASDASHSPTLPRAGSELGLILGTAGYMSPEQARGKPVDKRADIWAFGVVLFEMLTGKRLFQGETVSDTLAAVLKTDPDWRLLPAETPQRIRELLRRCLTRDPHERLRDIGDARLELGRPLSEPEALSAVAAGAIRAPGTPRAVSWLALAVAVAAAGLLGGLATGFIRSGSSPGARPGSAEVRFTISLPDGVAINTASAPAVSPDGSAIAFVASRVGQPARLWVRKLGDATPTELPGTDEAWNPFWSPDGMFIGLLTLRRELKKIPAAGGPIETLCSVSDAFLEGAAATWGRDGTILFSGSMAGGLRRLPSSGGAPTPVTEPDRAQGELGHVWPRFLPNGRQFLYTAVGRGSAPRVAYVQSLDGGERRRLVEVQSSVVYAADAGQLLFVRQRALLAQRFDEHTLETTGGPLSVHGGFVSGYLIGAFDASGGTLVRRDTRRDTALAWFDRTGRQIRAVAMAGDFGWPAIALDDRRIAIDRANPDTGVREVWVLDGDRSTRLTFGPDDDSDAVWAPDGQRVAFAQDLGRSLDEIGLGAAAGRRTMHRFSGGSDEVFPTDWSKDGRLIAYTSYGQGGGADVYLLRVEADAKPVAVAATRFNEQQARFSPGGRFIAYASDESARPEVYVQAMPPATGRWQASTAGGAQPMWRRDGRELFYLALDNTLMAVPVSTGTTFDVGTPAPLFRIRLDESPFVAVRNHYAVTGDGQRFLVNSVTGGSRLQVIATWRGGHLSPSTR